VNVVLKPRAAGLASLALGRHPSFSLAQLGVASDGRLADIPLVLACAWLARVWPQADNARMPAISLTPTQRRAQRSAAHHLDPVVIIGADGLTPPVQAEIDQALSAHGLIKVRVFMDDRLAREQLLATLADRLDASPIQHIGKLLVLWRPLPDKERVVREGRKPGPKVVKILKFSKSANHRPTVKKVRVLGNERVTPGGSIKRAKARTAGLKRRSQAR